MSAKRGKRFEIKFNFVKALLLECHLRFWSFIPITKTTRRLIPGRFRRIPHLDEACACRQQQIARFHLTSSPSSATVITTLSYSFREPGDNRRSESFFICLRSAHRVSSDVSHCARVFLSSELVSNCPAKHETVASASSSSFLCFIARQQPANRAIPLHRASKMSAEFVIECRRSWKARYRNRNKDGARLKIPSRMIHSRSAVSTWNICFQPSVRVY